MRKLFYAIAILVGTIVGVGIFALPYVARESGFLVVLGYLLILGTVVTILHLILGEILERTGGKHRIPGLIRLYLGESWYQLARLLTIVGVGGALLVYLIVGGTFLSHIFGTYSPQVYSILFWIVFSIFILGGFTLFEFAEFVMSGLLVLMTLGALGIAIPHISWDVFSSLPPDNTHVFLPYGIVLFSLFGTAAIPELYHLLRNQPRHLRTAIRYGTLIPIGIYILFIVAIYGVSREHTTPDAIQGFQNVIGDGIVPFLYIFGFLAIATSYITLGIYARDVCTMDFKIPRKRAGVYVLGIPLLLFLMGVENYIEIIGALGSIVGSMEGILLVMTHAQARARGMYTPAYSVSLSWGMHGVLILFFLFGLVAGTLTLYARTLS